MITYNLSYIFYLITLIFCFIRSVLFVIIYGCLVIFGDDGFGINGSVGFGRVWLFCEFGFGVVGKIGIVFSLVIGLFGLVWLFITT